MKKIQVGEAASKIIASRVDVKSWLAQVPEVDAVRPATCPCCGRAGDVPGKRKEITGHGLRERQQRGPLAAGGAPQLVAVLVRRYACGCGAILTVVPRETVARRLYTVSAVAWALALFGVERATPADVRRRTSPWAIVGDAAVSGWATLRRWIHAVRTGALLPKVRQTPADFTDRQVAERAAATLAALAPPTMVSAVMPERAFVGAARSA